MFSNDTFYFKTIENIKVKWFQLVFHWCLYNKQNITCPLMDMNFIFSWSTRYLTSERSERVRYRVDHEKIKFISTRGHVISSIYLNKTPARILQANKLVQLTFRVFQRRKLEISWAESSLLVQEDQSKQRQENLKRNVSTQLQHKLNFHLL